MWLNYGRMSAKDFVKASANPADKVLSSTSCEEICTFAVLVLDAYDFVQQNKQYILKELDVTTPSLKMDSPLQLTAVESIGLFFRGETLEILMVVEREDLHYARTLSQGHVW